MVVSRPWEWTKQAGMSEEAEHLRKRYRFRERRRTDRSYVAESKLENLARGTRSWLVNDGKQACGDRVPPCMVWPERRSSPALHTRVRAREKPLENLAPGETSI